MQNFELQMIELSYLFQYILYENWENTSCQTCKIYCSGFQPGVYFTNILQAAFCMKMYLQFGFVIIRQNWHKGCS